jgi:hypothetical protein
MLVFRTVITDMKDMNERVRALHSSIDATDREFKNLLEQRVTGVAVMDDEKVGGATKIWINAEEENKLKLYERKLNDRVNEFEKRIGACIANNIKDRHAIQEYRGDIMAIKQEMANLEQVALGVEFMTKQHGLLTGIVLDEQRKLKDMQFESIKTLKDLQQNTAAECQKLENQCDQMDARMQAVENELLEKPPDRAAMNEMAQKKAAAKLELKETKATAEALELKMKKMLVKMGIAPTYAMKEIEGEKPFYYISNDSFLEAFQSFEDKAFKGENEITTKKMKISQLESEISVLNDEYESTMQNLASVRDKQKEQIDLKSRKVSAAEAAASDASVRLAQKENLLVQMERNLAKINDKLAKAQTSPSSKVLLPIREVFVPPVPDSPFVRTRKLLEERMFRLLGSKTKVLATDLLCNAGTVDLVCSDRRDRLVLVCFANPLTGYCIDTALVSHCSEIQSAFYMLRRLPASSINALKVCFLDADTGSVRDIFNARVHRFVIIGESIGDDCDISSFASGVELVKADNIGDVWHGESTKRLLLGGVPSPEELSELIHADASFESDILPDSSQSQFRSSRAWAILRDRRNRDKLLHKQIASANKITYRQFLDWIHRSVPPGIFVLPPDTTIDGAVEAFIINDMKWSLDTHESQEQRLLGSIGPHAIYRYIAQIGEHINLFSACGVTFTQLSPSPPAPDVDSGLEVLVEVWKSAAAAQRDDTASASVPESENEVPMVPAKHEVAGGTWIVEAIARLVLRYIGCVHPITEKEQQTDLEALKAALRNSQADEEKDKVRRDLKYQRKCSKRFSGLSHSEEFVLFGHQMLETQQNLKQCEDLLRQFLDLYAADIVSHNAKLKPCEAAVASDLEEDVLERRRQRSKALVRPPSLSSSDEDESIAQHRKKFEEV